MTSTNAIKVLIIEDDVGIAEIHRRNLMKIDGLDVNVQKCSKHIKPSIYEYKKT